MNQLNNKIALVTGGNSGIGRATARELLQQGATVIITGRRKDAIEAAAAELGAIPFVADQASLSDTEGLHQFIAAEYGRLDLLFINAGVTGQSALIEHSEEANFDTVMAINFKGAYFTLSRLIPLLQEGASVVFLSSIVATMHKPYSSVYQASKAALNSIAKTAAAELAGRKIRVNMVSPGPTRTEILNKAGLDETALAQLQERLIDAIPLKKMGAAEDVAQLVCYLFSDAANFITGAEVVADGGMLLGTSQL
jgi:NAD(P)-dependent dehydrogenase (short-subunit alcohol dehydrogenase family)